MHYYSQNIGDYRKDTMHLSMLEHGAYRQLIDTYYLSEKPLTLDRADLMRTHSARSADEMRAVENVLKDFFIRTTDGYIHKRCDIEIEAFHAKSKSNSESAKARWDRVRAEKEAYAMRTHSEGNANHKPLTINQEPETIGSKALPAEAGEKKPATRKARLPDPFLLTGEMRSWAAESAPATDLKVETEKFVDYFRGEAKTKADWPATWRNWIRKAQQDAQRGVRGGYSSAPVNKQQQIEDANMDVVRQIREREASRQAAEQGGNQEPIDTGDIIIEGEFIHAP